MSRKSEYMNSLSLYLSLWVCVCVSWVGKGKRNFCQVVGFPKTTPSLAPALALTWPREQSFLAVTGHIILWHIILSCYKQAHICLQPRLGNSSHYSLFPAHWDLSPSFDTSVNLYRQKCLHKSLPLFLASWKPYLLRGPSSISQREFPSLLLPPTAQFALS